MNAHWRSKNGSGGRSSHVIYNGVRDISPNWAEREREPVRLISVARLEAPKDHATLLEALGTLRGFEWELELVGDGPLAGTIREQTVRLGLGERVRFAGYVPDPAPLLAQAHVFVLSSLSEGFPRTILEAMRAGLPVDVLSDRGGDPGGGRGRRFGNPGPARQTRRDGGRPENICSKAQKRGNGWAARGI